MGLVTRFLIVILEMWVPDPFCKKVFYIPEGLDLSRKLNWVSTLQNRPVVDQNHLAEYPKNQ